MIVDSMRQGMPPPPLGNLTWQSLQPMHTQRRARMHACMLRLPPPAQCTQAAFNQRMPPPPPPLLADRPDPPHAPPRAAGCATFSGKPAALPHRTFVAHDAAVLYDPANHTAMYDMQPRPPEQHPGNSYLFRCGIWAVWGGGGSGGGGRRGGAGRKLHRLLFVNTQGRAAWRFAKACRPRRVPW